MPYLYRYIDLQKEEVVYVGKVTTYHDHGLDDRHKQHRRDGWYKELDGDNNLLLQYIYLNSHTDADIFETWLIQYYDTGQLFNIAKVGWGDSSIDLSNKIFGNWEDYDIDKQNFDKWARSKFSEAMSYYIYGTYEENTFKKELGMAIDYIHEAKRESVKLKRIPQNRKQDDFKRHIDISDVAS